MRTRIRVINATIALSLMGLSSACSGSGLGEDGTVKLTVVVRASSEAPENYGVEPGAVIAGAVVSVQQVESGYETSISGTTDDTGRVVFSVVPGTYSIAAERNTHDPYCTWHGFDDVELSDSDKTVKLYDLGVLCQ